LDLLNTSITEITALFDTGALTSETLVEAYLGTWLQSSEDLRRRSGSVLTADNIDADNRRGLQLRAVIDVAPREHGEPPRRSSTG
jgi:hypothetical protein